MSAEQVPPADPLREELDRCWGYLEGYPEPLYPEEWTDAEWAERDAKFEGYARNRAALIQVEVLMQIRDELHRLNEGRG